MSKILLKCECYPRVRLEDSYLRANCLVLDVGMCDFALSCAGIAAQNIFRTLWLFKCAHIV